MTSVFVFSLIQLKWFGYNEAPHEVLQIIDIRRIHHSRLRGMGFGFQFNNQEADSLNVWKNSIMLGSLWWMVWQMMSDASFFLLILRIPNLRFFHTLAFSLIRLKMATPLQAKCIQKYC
ncbi:Hypothetical_protein [Hexamita inflata]|uniref:Hypothetical_protein n=1 Tax=Hexamita inflata TaxID=28002 RepID=A0ABP1GUK0_9EUKA